MGNIMLFLVDTQSILVLDIPPNSLSAVTPTGSEFLPKGAYEKRILGEGLVLPFSF